MDKLEERAKKVINRKASYMSYQDAVDILELVKRCQELEIKNQSQGRQITLLKERIDIVMSILKGQ